jgi:hypothetical protein
MNEWLQVLSPIVGAGLVLAVIKGWLGRIERRMDCFEKAQHACQLANAKEFATWVEHNKLSDHVYGLDTRVTKLEGKYDRPHTA